MSAAPTPSPKPVSSAFRVWFRQEFFRELRLSAVFLLAGLALVSIADRVSPRFAPAWTRINYQLTNTALEQHPTALLDAFAARLSETQYGWGFFSLTEPFNVTAAREHLRTDFPEFVGVDPNGQPLTVRSSTLRRANAAQREARAAAYLERHRAIESRRFARLYPDDSPFDVPPASVRLGRLVTKILGLPDATLHLFRRTLSAGTISFLLFSGTFALSAVALWTSARPARHWLKALLCPFLASTLAWVVILLMSISAALFGGFTPNTSALAVFAGAPLLYLAAKIPLRLLEELQLKPKAWDGVERRKAPRPPVGAPGS
jgi:hypothetical protein